MDSPLEEHLTVFVDFLGFQEASLDLSRLETQGLLLLLREISILQGNFSIDVQPSENGSTIRIRPAISSFSDHVVISYPLRRITEDHGVNGGFMLILQQVHDWLIYIATRALDLGFLIRGGAAIGKLLHQDMVVFGPAMIEAYKIESSIAIYPRVVLSESICRQYPFIKEGNKDYVLSEDGLFSINYLRGMVLRSAQPGEYYRTNMLAWYDRATTTISSNLKTLKSAGRMKEYSKWSWFARRFKDELSGVYPQTLEAFGVKLDKIDW